MNGNGSADNDDAGMATCRNPWAWSGDKAVGRGLPTWLYGRQFISVFRNHASFGSGEAIVKMSNSKGIDIDIRSNADVLMDKVTFLASEHG